MKGAINKKNGVKFPKVNNFAYKVEAKKVKENHDDTRGDCGA